MSNFIVPNTFVPGTKAKAQEVNENFASIQEELNGKAEKEGNISQVFYVADATNNNHAVNKSQLDNAILNVSENLNDLISRIGTSFVVERGYTDSNGNPAYMTATDSELSFLVNDTNYGPIVALPANNLPRFSVNSVDSIDLNGYADGTYNVFLKSDGTAYVYSNTIYTQKSAPASPSMNTIFVDTSISPITAKIYKDSNWSDFNDIYLGSITVSNNAITNIKHANFNDNGLNVNRSNITTLKKSYTSGASGYRIYSDGFCEQWGKKTGAGSSGSISLLKTMNNTNYNIILTNGYTATMTTSICFDKSNITTSSFGFYKVTTSTVDILWKVSGYLASGQY